MAGYRTIDDLKLLKFLKLNSSTIFKMQTVYGENREL